MKITLRQKPDGIAIFIVLICIFVLAALAWPFARTMTVETKLAANSNNETEMEWLGRSGVEMARYVLAQEMTTPGPGQRFDALNQKWAGGTGETNDLLASINLIDVPLGNGKFSVHITDNERKFNINTAVINEALMTQSLILIGTDASEIPTIIASIQDWIDRDDETHINGAESEYYQTLSPPYFAKNGPIDDMTELLLVKGVTPDIYWGPNSTNHPASMFQQRQPATSNGQSGPPAVSAGLVDIFTPISSGQININTCSATMLRMIGMDEASANRVISLRAGPDGQDGTDDDVPFNNPGEIINAGLPPAAVGIFTPYLTVRSSTFDVRVDVEVGMSKRRYHALVHRGSPRDIQILTFNWD